MDFLFKIRSLVMLVATMSFFSACDSDTATLGSGIMPDEDGMNVSQAVYKVYSRSIKVDSVLATTSTCHLGRVTDPETNATTTADFLAQFHILDFGFPADSLMIKENGEFVIDSVGLTMFISGFYGDSLNSMKMGVYELDTANVMGEGSPYYTNINPEQFVNNSPTAIRKETTFSVADLSLPDSILAKKYQKAIRIGLPKEYGRFILNQYYNHPEYFKNSYTFMRHVCAGFYAKTLSGNGTIVDIATSTLDIGFKYREKGQDSVYSGVYRMAATEEVIQNNHIENKNMEALINEKEHSYLKTPAGIFTEVTIPIDSIYKGTHRNDTINSAKILFTRQNNSTTFKYNLEVPGSILMIPKTEMYSFFTDEKLADQKTSFIAKYVPKSNAYTFSNIANLVSYFRNLRETGSGVTQSDSESVRNQKYKEWEAKNPDWGKVVLIPIQATYNSSQQLIRNRHELGMRSTKLIGGDTGDLSISIIYSRFNQ